MKQEVLIGQTDYTVLVKIRDTDGAPATGLTEASIDIAYARVETDNDVTTADVTPAALAALTTAHTDWGFEEVSATDHPGLYRLDIADAVFAAGAWSAVVTITGTGLDPADLEFVMVPSAPLAGVLLAPTTHTSAVIPTVTTATAVTTVNGLAANVITATSIASDAITAAKIAAGAIDAATFAADVDAEILSYIVDDATRIDASALNTASGAVGSNGSGLTEAGGTGDHLTAVPWNANWDAQVESEVADALAVYDPPTKAELDAAVANVSVDEIQATALADLFNTDSATTYASAVAGSVVAEIADNAGGSALTAAAIADAVWDEDATGHQTGGTFGQAIGDPGADTNTIFKAVVTDATGATVGVDGAAILADTNELQTDWVNGGRLDLLIDAIKAKTDNLPADPADASDIAAAIAALNDLSAADVNAQVLDVLNVDTFAEPTGVPSATTTLALKIGYLFMALRNRIDVTSSKKTFYDDGDAAEWEKDLSDDGTTYSESEGNAI